MRAAADFRTCRHQTPQAKQAAKKAQNSAILSEAKNDKKLKLGQSFFDFRFVFGKIAGDDRNIKAAEDGFLGLAFQQKLERFPDKFLRFHGPARQFLIVFWIQGDLVGGLTTGLDHANAKTGSIKFFHFYFCWHSLSIRSI